mmetsp:Transcript_8053/g.30237  ORF Transcript_8053/g.30237 Transcript_8053/m.30237 type:complete len:530 (+) Transcript_8053:1009-2598(+)
MLREELPRVHASQVAFLTILIIILIIIIIIVAIVIIIVLLLLYLELHLELLIGPDVLQAHHEELDGVIASIFRRREAHGQLLLFAHGDFLDAQHLLLVPHKHIPVVAEVLARVVLVVLVVVIIGAFPLQGDVHVEHVIRVDLLRIAHFMGHLQARIAIAEVGHVVDLRWSQACQRLRALIVLHFRHVVHAAGVEGLLDPLAALLREVRQLEKLALRLPNPHGDALEQLHTAQGRLQEAAGRRDVHESADELGDELAHLLRIRLHLGRQPETRDVRTKKPRNARGAGRERHGDVLRHPRESARVVQVRADALQFRRRRDNLEHAAQLRLRLDTGGEDLYAIVRNAVVRGDHAEVQTDEVAVVFHRDAAALLQVSHGVLHQLGQVLADAFVGGSGDAVVVWILGHTPIEQRPREPVHRVILALDDLVLNVRVQVVVHALVKVRLDRERVAQHLAQEVLLVRVGKDVSAALVVDVRPAGAAHHVQKIRHAVVHQPVASRVVLLRSHDADQVCTQLKIPRHRRRAHHDSNHAV